MQVLERVLDLEIPKRKGPFYLRKLGVDEVMTFMRDAEGKKQSAIITSLVQKCLINGNGKSVYAPSAIAKMEADLGGVKIISLGMQCQELNDFDELARFNQKMDAAEGN